MNERSKLSDVFQRVCIPDVSKTKLWEIRELLDLDYGIIERWLQALCHHVSQDHCNHHGQNVRNLPGQLKADHCCRNCVCDCTGHRCGTWTSKQ